MALITAAAIAASFNSRFPNLAPEQGGVLDSVSAAAAKPVPESEVLPGVQAMAVIGFADTSGNLQWVRAKEHFHVGFELVKAGDIVQVREGDAKRLVNAYKAEIVSDEEVAKAQKAAK